MKINFPVALFSFLLFSQSAFALGESPWTKVTDFLQGTGSNPVFMVENAGAAGTGCGSTVNQFVLSAVDDSSPRMRQYVTIVSSLQKGQEIKVTTSSCLYGMPDIRTVRIRGRQ